MKKQLLTLSILALVSVTESSFALDMVTARYFNGPSISKIAETGATLSLSTQVLNGLTEEEKKGVYFEYSEPEKVCIAIYPTPESCLPKKTEVGKTEVVLTGLTPGTTYRVVYKKDNTIRCITTPCPENGFESVAVTFVTKQSSSATTTPNETGRFRKDVINKSLGFRSSGEEVRILQVMLLEKGYMQGMATGYFGTLTLRAVKDFQKTNSITPTGFVGPLTRTLLNGGSAIAKQVSGERFSGTISAYSTACFADGECSITIDGKKVVTTRGWSQEVVGSLKGVASIGDIETKLGAHATVYAQKTEDGYTLYGNKDFFVDVK